jgi:hypothetical protein
MLIDFDGKHCLSSLFATLLQTSFALEIARGALQIPANY